VTSALETKSAPMNDQECFQWSVRFFQAGTIFYTLSQPFIANFSICLKIPVCFAGMALTDYLAMEFFRSAIHGPNPNYKQGDRPYGFGEQNNAQVIAEYGCRMGKALMAKWTFSQLGIINSSNIPFVIAVEEGNRFAQRSAFPGYDSKRSTIEAAGVAIASTVISKVLFSYFGGSLIGVMGETTCEMLSLLFVFATEKSIGKGMRSLASFGVFRPNQQRVEVNGETENRRTFKKNFF